MTPTELNHEDVLAAAIDLIGRTGAIETQIRYSDDEEPTVWIAVAGFHAQPDGRPGRGVINHYEAAGALVPAEAAVRLAEQILDGAPCARCGLPCGVDVDWDRVDTPLDRFMCWVRYDPELKTFAKTCGD